MKIKYCEYCECGKQLAPNSLWCEEHTKVIMEQMTNVFKKAYEEEPVPGMDINENKT